MDTEASAAIIVVVLRFVPQFEAGPQPGVVAAQACGRIVRRQVMALEVGACEHGDDEAIADEAPARQYGGRELAATHVDIAERARVVVVDPATEHQLEHESFAVKPVRRPQQPAIGEAAMPPKIGGGEQEKMGLVAGAYATLRPRPGVADIYCRGRKDGGRGNAPNPTHRGPPASLARAERATPSQTIGRSRRDCPGLSPWARTEKATGFGRN